MNKVKPSLKIKSMPLSLKQRAMQYVADYNGSSIEEFKSVLPIQYKGVNYVMVSREVKDKINTTQYAELMKLKQYVGVKGIPVLENFSSSLSPYSIKRAMKRQLANSTLYKSRSLIEVNGDKFSMLFSTSDDMSSIGDRIKREWAYSPAGKKAEKRYTQKNTYKRNKRLFGDVHSQMSGLVHQEGGLYLRAYTEKMTRILDTNKTPMTTERHLGIELEFLMPKDNKVNIKAALLASPFANMLTLTRDGSVTSNSTIDGAELKICAPISKMIACVSEVTKILAVNGCSVDKSCGLHVHLDARNDDVRAMFDKLLDQQSTLFALVPSSRRDNQYCRPTARKDFCKGSRYKTINSLSFRKYKTLEVRLHGGTIDPNKIINWITLLTTIAYNTQEITQSRSVKTLLAKLPFGEPLKEWYLERAVKFGKHGSVNHDSSDNN
jgi:hypothetical protein